MSRSKPHAQARRDVARPRASPARRSGAERPGFHRRLGQLSRAGRRAAATRRSAGAVAAARRSQGQGRRVSRSRRSARRHAGRRIASARACRARCSAPAAIRWRSCSTRTSSSSSTRRTPRSAASTWASAANPEDLFPDRNGYSFGRWEGDKLIVETTHLKEAVDQGRYPHSEQAKIVEEYTLARERRRHEGADVEDDDDGSRVLHARRSRPRRSGSSSPAFGCCRTSATSRFGKSTSNGCAKDRASPAEPSRRRTVA